MNLFIVQTSNFLIPHTPPLRKKSCILELGSACQIPVKYLPPNYVYIAMHVFQSYITHVTELY